jgi:hypothetical protein
LALTVTATSAVELAPNSVAKSGLYLLATSTACYLNFGTTSGVSAASSTTYTVYFPANFSCIFRPPARWVTGIRDTADGTLILTPINEVEAAKT